MNAAFRAILTIDRVLTWRRLSGLTVLVAFVPAFTHDSASAAFLVAFACYCRIRAIDDGEPRSSSLRFGDSRPDGAHDVLCSGGCGRLMAWSVGNAVSKATCHSCLGAR